MSERELLAQWAAEELFAAGRAEDNARPVHRARGCFYADALQELSGTKAALPAPAAGVNPFGRLLVLAFGELGRTRRAASTKLDGVTGSIGNGARALPESAGIGATRAGRTALEESGSSAYQCDRGKTPMVPRSSRRT
jgi:hypothetical protein